MTPAEFQRRQRSFERSRTVVAVLGALPLLGAYLMVHTPWLKRAMADHQHLLAALLILVPLLWILVVVRGWRRLGPRLLGFVCGRCRASLVDAAPSPPDAGARCPQCGSALFEASRGETTG